MPKFVIHTTGLRTPSYRTEADDFQEEGSLIVFRTHQPSRSGVGTTSEQIFAIKTQFVERIEQEA